MRNLEIKVRVDALSSLRGRLGFAVFQGVLEQKDTYYLLGAKRLKIREEGGRSEIIFYSRVNKNGTRESSYRMLKVYQFFVPILKFLLDISYGVKIVVEKRRDLYLFKNTRIHLDTVAKLGTFIELETVMREEGDDTQYMAEHNKVKDLLLLEQFPSISGSYSDLLLVGRITGK